MLPTGPNLWTDMCLPSGVSKDRIYCTLKGQRILQKYLNFHPLMNEISGNAESIFLPGIHRLWTVPAASHRQQMLSFKSPLSLVGALNHTHVIQKGI